MTKSRRMSWAWHVAHMVERRGVYRVLVEKPEGKKPHGRPRRRWNFTVWDIGVWTGSSWLGIGTGECSNEPSGSIKCGEFLDLLRTG